jgi:8-amino-7-oxononanoate synthase
VWVATDGWCPGCNRAAPLGRLNEVAVEGGGALMIDDTLAFGVLGRRRSATGFGDGTGTPSWCGLHHRGILWVASLAKEHGSPLAVISGDHEPIAALMSDGSTRAHCSPPTAADLAAALASVEDIPGNRTRRAMLEDRVHRVRLRLGRAGLAPVGAPFPLVAVPLGEPDIAAGVARLRRNGVRGLALTSRCTGRPMLGVLVRADVSTAGVDRSADALVAAACRGSTGHRSAS